jgi:hypothetical protein
MLDAYRDLIDELLETPSTLRELVGDRDTVAPELMALLAELRDRDVAMLSRLQTMLSQSDALLKPMETDRGTAEHDLNEIVTEFEKARGDLVSHLMNLTLRDWERSAIDEHGAEVTLADEVERHVEFNEDHLRRLQAAAG